jgi:hypothetical protein
MGEGQIGNKFLESYGVTSLEYSFFCAKSILAALLVLQSISLAWAQTTDATNSEVIRKPQGHAVFYGPSKFTSLYKIIVSDVLLSCTRSSSSSIGVKSAMASSSWLTSLLVGMKPSSIRRMTQPALVSLSGSHLFFYAKIVNKLKLRVSSQPLFQARHADDNMMSLQQLL